MRDKIQKDGIPTFSLIKQVFVKNDLILLGCQRLINLGFEANVFAYKVELDSFFYIKRVNRNKLNYNLSYIFHGCINNNFVMWDEI